MNETKPPARFSSETKWFLHSAACLAGVYLLASLLGWREHTTVLAATVSGTKAFLGMCYLLLHFIFVVLVPILVVAGTINHVWEKNTAQGSPSKDQNE